MNAMYEGVCANYCDKRHTINDSTYPLGYPMKLDFWRTVRLTRSCSMSPITICGPDLKTALQAALPASLIEPIDLGPGVPLQLWYDAAGSIGIAPVLNPAAMWVVQAFRGPWDLPVIWGDVYFLAVTPGGFPCSLDVALDHHLTDVCLRALDPAGHPGDSGPGRRV